MRWVVALVVVLSGCGGSAKPAATTSTTLAALDPCDLLTTSELTEAIGAPVIAVVTNDTIRTQSRCTWTLDSGTVTLVLFDDAIAAREFGARPSGDVDVPGVGEGARWTARDRALTFTAGGHTSRLEIVVDPPLADERVTSGALALQVLRRR